MLYEIIRNFVFCLLPKFSWRQFWISEGSFGQVEAVDVGDVAKWSQKSI